MSARLLFHIASILAILFIISLAAAACLTDAGGRPATPPAEETLDVPNEGLLKDQLVQLAVSLESPGFTSPLMHHESAFAQTGLPVRIILCSFLL